MNKYHIHFSIGGKPLQTVISAECREDAEDILRSAVIIDRVKLVEGKEPEPEH